MSKINRAAALILAGCLASTQVFAADPVSPKDKTSPHKSFRSELEALDPAAEVDLVDDRILAAGLGAIGGVLTFNLLTGGIGGLPFIYSYGAPGVGATMTGVNAARGAVAVSRVYAVSSAVAGGLVGDYLYRRANANRLSRIPKSVADRVAPTD